MHAKDKKRNRQRRSAESVAESSSLSTLEQTRAAFRGCARCSYLLAGFQALYGRAHLDAALAASRQNWLHLTWPNYGDLLRLLDDHYGYRVLADTPHFEAICGECRRVFVYHAELLSVGDDEGEPLTAAPSPVDEPGVFHLQVLPRPRN